MDCHGPKGRKKGERGAESVRTVIGKGCLWLVIYIPALVNGICRGYIDTLKNTGYNKNTVRETVRISGYSIFENIVFS